jgi:hypothetical protein
MILASGYNTDNEKAVNSILLYNYTVLYIAGEYFIVNAFNAASISQEHHSVEGLVINELIDKLATANANSIETEIANFIIKSSIIKRQYHKNEQYIWFQSCRKSKVVNG